MNGEVDAATFRRPRARRAGGAGRRGRRLPARLARSGAPAAALAALAFAWGAAPARAQAAPAPPAAAQTVAGRIGPYDIPLFAAPAAPHATGAGRLVYAASPFGVAVTPEGRARYDVRVTAAGLPAPSALGAYAAYVAWAVTPDLSTWSRLGEVGNDTTTVGPVDFNKFLLVITAEATATPAAHAGPTVLHGASPSTWLQSFLSHPMFRGVW